MKNIHFLWVVLSLIVMSGMGIVPNALALDGKTLFIQKTCNVCHGTDGKAPVLPMYPKLAGQNSIYALQQMKDIKSGKRSNGNSKVMKGIMINVSEAEMKAIAEYLQKVKF